MFDTSITRLLLRKGVYVATAIGGGPQGCMQISAGMQNPA